MLTKEQRESKLREIQRQLVHVHGYTMGCGTDTEEINNQPAIERISDLLADNAKRQRPEGAIDWNWLIFAALVAFGLWVGWK